MSEILSDLRTEFRTAILLRKKGLALALLKQLTSLDPDDQDSHSNLNELVKGVTREVERVTQQFTSPVGESTDRSALIDALDEKVPYWRSFSEEIPQLAALTVAVQSTGGLERELRSLLNQAECEDAVAKWLEEGGPMNLEGTLSILMKHLEAAQSCEESVHFKDWTKALADIESLDVNRLSDEIAGVTKWTAASRWRLKARRLIVTAKSMGGKKAKTEGPALASQLAELREELRTRPELSGKTSIDGQLVEASSVLTSLIDGPTPRVWLFPLAFIGMVAAITILLLTQTQNNPQDSDRIPQEQPNTTGSSAKIDGRNDPPPPKALPPVADADAYDPKPASDDVTISLPNDWKMVFRKVYLPSPTTKPGVLDFETAGKSATVWAPFSDSEGRYYLLAKYETTRGQYAQFMTLSAAAEASTALPITNITVEDIERFCEEMSKWLGNQSTFTLKSISGRPGRVRLPTMAEWQYAACGGIQTFGTPLFKERWPWGGPVTPREWHSGPASSSGKLRKVGVLAPHPLGMFDMLGNARELAATAGQYWMVGCDYGTADTEFSVFSNELIPRLMPNSNRAFQQPEVGFRLVLSADADAFQQGPTTDQ